MTETDDYLSFLHEEFDLRRRRNAGYSRRAFARDLGLGSSTLSEVLGGRHCLSLAKAAAIARRLQWSAEKTRDWLSLVSKKARRRSREDRAVLAVDCAMPPSRYEAVPLEVFRMMADCAHLGLLELVPWPAFQDRADWIARRLGISVQAARDARSRLLRLGLLETFAGKLRVRSHNLHYGKDIADRGVKAFYRSLLKRWELAIPRPTAEREFGSLVLSFDRAQLPRARAMLRKFKEEFDQEFSAGARGDAIYALGLGFFELS